MRVKIKKLKNGAIIPTRGSNKAAGFDLYANCDVYVVIEPHTTVKIGTGVAITPPEGYFGAIFARSGLSTKEYLRPGNCVGICDEDYTGEYRIPLHNDSDCPRLIKTGDRIAQLIFLPYIESEFEEVNDLEDTERGDGGFGSTGK